MTEGLTMLMAVVMAVAMVVAVKEIGGGHIGGGLWLRAVAEETVIARQQMWQSWWKMGGHWQWWHQLYERVR